MLRRWKQQLADVARVALVVLAVAAITETVAPAQAQVVDGSVRKSVEACQRVAKKHAILADSTMQGALHQLADTNATMEGYLRQWGSRVVAGAGGDAAGVAVKVASCVRDFAKAAEGVAAKLQDKLLQSVATQIRWYDDKVFSLFTEVLSEQAQAGIVQSVKRNLEPTLKVFGNEAGSSLKQSIKDLKPGYQVAAKCIREQSLQSDDFPEQFD